VPPPVAAEFKGNVPVVQTEIWQALKPAKHEQLIKFGLIKITPQWSRASGGPVTVKNVLRSRHGPFLLVRNRAIDSDVTPEREALEPPPW
jgi:hypothetical protein